jgi:gamma-glutamylcyclotransferase (GGCT)/AIG2-like uncharacterized protein YtfP
VKHAVFVYGTLLSGEGNHRLLAGGAFLGDARTAPGFELYDLGAFPGMVARGAGVVAGEVYGVDDATRARLDALEGHPQFYRRRAIRLADGKRVDTYLLRLAQVKGCEVIASGSWLEHRKETKA